MNAHWIDETIFDEGDAYFSSLLESIHQANKCIKIETYIFELDTLGLRVLESLNDAAKRGVLVQLLLDGAGCSEWDYNDAQKYRNNNLEIQFFHPLPWQRKHSKLWTYFSINKIVRGFSLLNHRNHRKVFLIDEDLAYAGSMNVTGKHLKSIYQQNTWRDTGIKIKGDKIKVLHESFEEAWKYYNNYILRYLQKAKTSSGLPLLILNRTIKQRSNAYHNLIKRITQSKTSIYITNPYFIPTSKIRKSLKSAVNRGVKVKAIFPSKSDFFGVKMAMESNYTFLLKSGVQIFEYQPSMIHAKILITDQHILIGSSNINSRSLLLDLEVDFEITHAENIKLIYKQFEEDLSRSKKIELNDWVKRSLFQKTLEKVFYWFKRVL